MSRIATPLPATRTLGRTQAFALEYPAGVCICVHFKGAELVRLHDAHGALRTFDSVAHALRVVAKINAAKRITRALWH
jgi:hypothetical protein